MFVKINSSNMEKYKEDDPEPAIIFRGQHVRHLSLCMETDSGEERIAGDR